MKLSYEESGKSFLHNIKRHTIQHETKVTRCKILNILKQKKTVKVVSFGINLNVKLCRFLRKRNSIPLS